MQTPNPNAKTRSTPSTVSETRKKPPLRALRSREHVTLAEVFAVLGLSDRARREAMRVFHSSGGSLDRFEGVHADRVRMVDALVRAEDLVEVDGRGAARALERSPDRVALRALRRRLESEVSS